MIAIIDYGMGNIHSVQKALEGLGAKTLVTNDPGRLDECDKIVLPGVGAFDDALEELELKGFIPVLERCNKEKKILLGICLGMQLMFESSQEGTRKGLGFIKGEVKLFDSRKGLKVPHMGWNRLQIEKKCPLLNDVTDGSYVYFCHSYYPQPKDQKVIAAVTEYGVDFASIVWQDNIYATQFHPEKSQDTGLAILRNFVKL